MIAILDSVLSEEDLRICQRAVVVEQQYTPHSSLDFTVTSYHNFMACLVHSESNPVYQKIIDSVYVKNLLSTNFSILRAYINANPAGEFNSGSFHTDEGNITILYYPCAWESAYGGATEFETGESVEYVANRAVLFDAKIRHRASEHFNPNSFRYSIAFKTDAHWA